MVRFSHVIRDVEGLHARSVAIIATAVRKWQSEVVVSCNGRSRNGDDIMGLMALDARSGDVLEVSIEGSDEQEAAKALREEFSF